MRKLILKGNTITIGKKRITFAHGILDAKVSRRLLLVIFDYMEFPKSEQAKNLQAYRTDGTLVWTAEHPTNESGDSYVSFTADKRLSANTFTGFCCSIDPNNGKLLKKEFTK